MDGTELTLDLMHVIELMDSPASYARAASMCVALAEKLRRVRVNALEVHAACVAAADVDVEALLADAARHRALAADFRASRAGASVVDIGQSH